MIDAPRMQDVQRLAEVRGPWCATVYGAAGSWSHGNRTTDEAAGQIREIVAGLTDAGAPAAETEAVRARLRSVAEPAAEDGGGRDRRAGSVGVFVTAASTDAFAFRTATTPRTEVADRFLVSPLLDGALELDGALLVLAISERRVRLVRIALGRAEQLPVPGLPRDLRSTVDLDLTGDRGTLGHLRTSEDPKRRLREYARAVDRAIAPVVRSAGGDVLIAAAEPLAAIVRATVSVPLLDAVLAGNPDEASPEELADRAVPVLEHVRRDAVERQLVRLAERDRRKLLLSGLEVMEGAVRDGTAETLLVDLQRRLPVPDGSGLDRVDELVRAALATGTTIVPVRPGDLPSGDPAAVVLRYVRADLPASAIG